ncbi:hypothetical protein FHS92_002000 [Sphingobium subterraneum]|uniref:Uncharacterized protein n=1 Tax=Sphingobium subterraneum TaxID=627688 RepID=A0A841J7X2_9SPHN|nr:hypothetical protein [Sphingobium subterraneum]
MASLATTGKMMPDCGLIPLPKDASGAHERIGLPQKDEI